MDNNSVLTRSKIRFAGISHVVFLVMAAGSGSGQVPLRRLVVPLRGPSGAPVGTAVFRTTITGKLSINIAVMNLSAGRHAVHIHENSVCDGAMDFLTAGDHFNPDERQHGYMNPDGHHAGDLERTGTGWFLAELRPGLAHRVELRWADHQHQPLWHHVLLARRIARKSRNYRPDHAFDRAHLFASRKA